MHISGSDLISLRVSELMAAKSPAEQGFAGLFRKSWEPSWSPRQESNLYLALRRRLFYPLNYGESHIRAFAQEMANRTAVWTARRV